MLEKVRKPGRAKSFFAYILFGAIVLVFVFMGVTPDQGPFTTGGSAAVVNGQIISMAQFRQRLMFVEEQQGPQLQGLPEEIREQRLRQMRSDVLEGMIVHELSASVAERERFKVADAEVRQLILDNEVFHDEDGLFRRERYEQILRANGWTSSEYERLLRRDIILTRLQESFAQALMPIPGQIERDEKLRGSSLNVGFVSFDRASLQREIEIPPRTLISFMESSEGLEKMRQLYEQNIEEYRTPERARARHILVEVEGPDDHLQRAAREKAEEIHSQLTVENFAAFAEEHSQDPGSAQRGGDLGWFSRGRMVPAFEEAAFSLPIGEMSEPVLSEFGYHIILVENREAESLRDFDLVKEELAQKILSRDLVDDELAEWEKLVQSGDEGALERRISRVGWAWSETGPFDLTREEMPRLGESDRLWNAVLERGQEGLVPQLITLGGRYHLIKVKDLSIGESGLSPLDPASAAQFFALMRTGRVFESWLDQEKAQAKIQRNAQLLSLN